MSVDERGPETTTSTPRTAGADPIDRGFFEMALGLSSEVVFYAVAGCLRYVTPSVEALLGWAPSELLGRATVHLWHPDDCGAAVALREAAYSGQPATGTLRMATRDGGFRWVEIVARRYVEATGRVGMFGTLRDASAQMESRHTAERAEQRFHLAMDRSAIGMCLVAPDGSFLRVNPALCAMLGRSQASLLASTWQDLTHPDDVPEDAVFVDEVLSGRSDGYRTQRRYLRSDGEVVWGDLSVACVRGEGGEVEYLISQLVDVSDFVRAREALRSSEQHYKLLAEHASDIVFRGSAEGRIEWVSESVTNQIGWRPSELVGRHIASILHMDDIPRMAAASRAVNAGSPGGYEARIATATGEYRWLAIVLKPVLDNDGRVIARVGSGRNIQAEVEARQELAASEERFRLLADNAADVVVRVRESVIVWASPSIAASFGGSRWSWVGKHLPDVFVADDASAYASAFEALRSAPFVSVRLRVRRVGGGRHWVDCVLREHLDGGGRPDGLVASFRVIDAQVAAEEELQRRARLDALTGLLNSAEAFRRANAILRGERRTGAATAVLFCDVDKFKAINDTLGHAAGDDALRMVAERIQDATRSGDLAARMGGDEFMVLLSGVRDLAAAAEVAEKIRAAVARTLDLGGSSVELSVSVGVTLASQHESLEAVVDRADAAMYEAKKRGRNQVISIAQPAGSGVASRILPTSSR